MNTMLHTSKLTTLQGELSSAVWCGFSMINNIAPEYRDRKGSLKT